MNALGCKPGNSLPLFTNEGQVEDCWHLKCIKILLSVIPQWFLGFGNIVYSVVPEHLAVVNRSLAVAPRSIAVMNVFSETVPEGIAAMNISSALVPEGMAVVKMFSETIPESIAVMNISLQCAAVQHL